MNRIKTILLIFAASVLTSEAANLQFTAAEKIDIAKGAYHPTLSADGSKVLYTADNYKGLLVYDFYAGKTTKLTDADAAGFCPSFSADGKSVVCRRSQLVGNLRNIAIDGISLDDGSVNEILPLGRHDISVARDIRGENVVKAGARVLSEKKIATKVVGTDFDKIVLSVDGVESRISPVPDGYSYLWASLSPDGSKLLFVEAFSGVYTCNLDGSDLKNYGQGNFPVWVDDSHFIITKQKMEDDFIAESRLYLVNASSASMLALTSPEMKAVEASVAQNARMVVFATDDGELYQMSFTVK